jgi:hypothetical protein
MPSRSASAIVSAVPTVTDSSQLFRTSFIRVPWPGSSKRIVREPIASKTGVQASRAPAGPAASTTSLPCSAGCFVPRTGASTKVTPASRARFATSSVAAMPIVLIWSQIEPSVIAPKPPSSPVMTSRTGSADVSMVITASAPAAAAAGVSAISMPPSASGSAFA